MTADPMVPDEAVEAFRDAVPGTNLRIATVYLRRALAAAMPALTAAARAEVAASVLGPVECAWDLLNKPSAEMTSDDWTELQENPLRYAGQWVEDFLGYLRAAVSDDGIANHRQQMRAEGWDEGYAAAHSMARLYGHTDHWEDEPANPYRAEAAGDQHHQGDDE
jgi:hypothetical protein